MNTKTELMKRLRQELAAPPYLDCQGLLLSVSGGVDSMVLLDVFVRMSHIHLSPLKVVHVHHGTGSFADHSLEIVRNFCHQLDVPLKVAHYNWDGTSNFEHMASTYRREVLEEQRAEDGWILLGHHLQDQAETFFQAVVRGAGITSPLGMAKCKSRRLRPFLGQDRALILAHAQACGVPHTLDPTNYTDSNFRNTIRHGVTPLLRGFHDRFEQRLSHWQEGHDALLAALSEEAETLFHGWFQQGVLDRTVFRLSKPYLWDFILKHFWEFQGLSKPKKREEQQLKRWLSEETFGSFDHERGRLYCDLDGLVLGSPPPRKNRNGSFGEGLDWGGFRFRLQMTEDGACRWHHSRLQLETPKAVAKRYKEKMRQNRIPYRLREQLPTFTFADGAYHLYDLLDMEKEGLLLFQQESGEDLRSRFVHSSE